MQSISSQTRAVGNSSGVLLPREWLNKKVVVTLVEPSEKEIVQDIIKILYESRILEEVLGIYLIGSHARKKGEITPESDIDILIITENITKTINKDNYQINLVKNSTLLKSLKEKPFYYYPMIYEAKTLLNSGLLSDYKNLKSNLKWNSFVKDTKNSLKETKKLINLDKSLGNNKTADSVAYSLVLRARGFYILGKILEGKLWEKKEFLEIIKRVTGNLEVYRRYLYLKKSDDGKGNTISIKDAEKLVNYLEKEISKWENMKKGKGRKG